MSTDIDDLIRSAMKLVAKSIRGIDLQTFLAVSTLFLNCLATKKTLGMEVTEEEKRVLQRITDELRVFLETKLEMKEV